MRNEAKVGSLTSVSWLDTISADKERTRTEALALEPILFTTYGIFLGRSKSKVTVACTIGRDDELPIYRDVITFPSEVVKSIKEVKS